MTELLILKHLLDRSSNVTDLAFALDKSKSHVSECASHMQQLGFVSSQRHGFHTIVQLSQSPMGNELAKLLREVPHMKFERLFLGSRLKMLPLLLDSGSTTRHISHRTGLSPRTVQTYLGRLKGMGIVVKNVKKYRLSPSHLEIISFVFKYSEHRNLSHLNAMHPNASLIWQYRDEYILSNDRVVNDPKYCLAAISRLAELGHDVIHRNEYYHYSPVQREICEAEALIQAMMIDPMEPRVKRFAQKSLRHGQVEMVELKKHALFYHLNRDLEELLLGHRW